MGYTHEYKWTDETIIEEVKKIIEIGGMSTFPTHSELQKYEIGNALRCAISRHGGTKKFAQLMKMEIKACESTFGESYEMKCIKEIEKQIGLSCEKMRIRYAYDLLVGGAVKVDVKVSRLFISKEGAKFFSFNLEKKEQTCDIYVCYCIGRKGEENQTFVIPSVVMNGKKQIAIGETRSIYDKYMGRWDLIKMYYDFMIQTILQ